MVQAVIYIKWKFVLSGTEQANVTEIGKLLAAVPHFELQSFGSWRKNGVTPGI